MFERGDAIVHPIRGAGVVTDIEERPWRGDSSLYYKIKLLGQDPSISLRVPVEEADSIGIRYAIPKSQVEQIWQVLFSSPDKLPSNHKTRYKFLKEKLHAGDVLQVAEVVRDLTWRQQKKDHLTTRGKRVYEEGIGFLSGEIAAAQNIDIMEADMKIRTKLREIRTSIKVV
jgi:CarD family transcriptional regulator